MTTTADGVSAKLVQPAIYRGAVTPISADIGDLWEDTSTNPPVLKQCTALPNTFVAVSTGGSAYNPSAVAITGGSVDATTVGATTASTGAFTTLSASSTVSGTGFSTYLASPPAIGGTAAAAGTFTTLIGGADVANYGQLTGGATTKAVEFKSLGTDTNVAYAIRSKGTGAIDLAAGSGGVNISNGGTVIAITITSQGSNYTSIPTTAITAPTTAGGVQATFSVGMFVSTWTVTNGGTGYTVGDIITAASGGTYSTPWTLLVNAVSGGVITAISTGTGSNAGTYTVLPSGAQSVTGGTGSSATITITTWGVRSGTASITNAGSGYVEQPTVSFSGGGGSGAAAYASVGGNSIVKGIGATMSFYAPNGEAFRIADGASTSAFYWQALGTSTQGILRSSGATAQGLIQTGGTGNLFFQTNAGVTQAVVSHTASAVNYVQVTGAATGSFAQISAQGSDAVTGLGITSKNAARINFFNNNGANRHVSIAGNGSSAVNYLDLNGNIASNAPSISVAGTDTNIDLTLTPKGTGSVVASAPVKLFGYTVATLPTAGTIGRTAYVTDALAPTYLGTLTGGGAVKTPVFDNGTAWVSY